MTHFRHWIRLCESHSTAIADVVMQELYRTGLTPHEVNDGHCGYLADHIVKALGVGEVRSAAELGSAYPAHEWVYVDGRHYDAETPFGVSDPRDLGYFCRHDGKPMPPTNYEADLTDWDDELVEGTERTMNAAETFEDTFHAAFAASGLATVSHMHLHSFGVRDVEISHIGVDAAHRGKGIGNQLMGMITELADQHSIILYASPATDADGETGLDFEALREWYERWDFIKLAGQDMMKREPFEESED